MSRSQTTPSLLLCEQRATDRDRISSDLGNRSTSIGLFCHFWWLVDGDFSWSLSRSRSPPPKPLQTGTTETNPGAEAAKTRGAGILAIIGRGCFWCIRSGFSNAWKGSVEVRLAVPSRAGNAFPTYNKFAPDGRGTPKAFAKFSSTLR